MTPKDHFHYEVDPGNNLTTFKFHGRLVAENRDKVEELIRTTPFTGRVVIDLSDISYLDSAGLGTLIRLKMSALSHNGVSVEFAQMTPRVMQLLKITNLAQWFSS
ncbi:MAG TPA: STAS domain-containing protein [Bryobacteraceae bacterium]|jgi:anti-anti-sigma factor|nr:STAS domain-containing protein [Bryobacteraceae bacterium]